MNTKCESLYEEWCGKSRHVNDCHPVHDSSEVIEFAELYHKESMTYDAVLADVEPVKTMYGNDTVIECRCSNISLKRHHLYCFKCGAKLDWRNFR